MTPVAGVALGRPTRQQLQTHHHETQEESIVTTCPYIDTRTIAGELGVTLQTVRNLIRRGELAAVRIGGRLRIYCDDYDNYLRRVGATPLIRAHENPAA